MTPVLSNSTRSELVVLASDMRLLSLMYPLMHMHMHMHVVER